MPHPPSVSKLARETLAWSHSPLLQQGLHESLAWISCPDSDQFLWSRRPRTLVANSLGTNMKRMHMSITEKVEMTKTVKMACEWPLGGPIYSVSRREVDDIYAKTPSWERTIRTQGRGGVIFWRYSNTLSSGILPLYDWTRNPLTYCAYIIL